MIRIWPVAAGAGDQLPGASSIPYSRILARRVWRAIPSWLAARLSVPGPRVVSAVEAGKRGAGASKRCRNARLRASGFRFRYPSYREGYGALLAAARPPV